MLALGGAAQGLGNKFMDLFGILGLSNATVLTYAAAVAGGFVVTSAVARMVNGKSGSGQLDQRVDRLEVRLAASGDTHSLLQAAENLLADIVPQGVGPVTEMFEAANLKRSWFSAPVEPSDIAQKVVDDLKDSIEIATGIARPIQNLNENGAMEVRAERRRVGIETKRLAAGLKTETWDRHGAQLLQGGMPGTTVTLLQNFFTHVHALKVAANDQSKSASVNGLMNVLHQSAELLKSAGQNAEEFKRLAE